MGRADRGSAEILAARLLRAYRTRPAQPMDPCLGLQGRRRTLQPARQSPRSRRLASGDPRPVRPTGEHVRRAGRVLAATLSLKQPPPQRPPPQAGEGAGKIPPPLSGEGGAHAVKAWEGGGSRL